MIKLKDILFEGNTSNETDLDNLFDELEDDIKQVELEPKNVDEAIGLTLAGIALSLPAIISLIGKFVNLLTKIPFLKKMSGDKLIALGDKYHHKITGAFEIIIKAAGVKDPIKSKKFANILHHTVIAMLLIVGGVSMSGMASNGNMSAATLKGALNAIKAKEIQSFLASSAEAIV